MEYIDLDSESLSKLTERRFVIETAESTVHPFFEQNKRKVFKLFKEGVNINNKVQKINMLSERLKNVDFVVTAESIVRYNGKVIGYIMPYIDGQLFDSLSFRKKDSVAVLKDIAKKLKILHELGIICADLINNILVDSNKNVYFIDHDNFSIDDLKVDTETILLKEYLKKNITFDSRFDNYLLNVFTLSVITRIHPKYLGFQYEVGNNKLYFKDDELSQIVDRTFNLSESYEEDLIVDKIETTKDLRKIRTRSFF